MKLSGHLQIGIIKGLAWDNVGVGTSLSSSHLCRALILFLPVLIKIPKMEDRGLVYWNIGCQWAKKWLWQDTEEKVSVCGFVTDIKDISSHSSIFLDFYTLYRKPFCFLSWWIYKKSYVMIIASLMWTFSVFKSLSSRKLCCFSIFRAGCLLRLVTIVTHTIVLLELLLKGRM